MPDNANLPAAPTAATLPGLAMPTEQRSLRGLDLLKGWEAHEQLPAAITTARLEATLPRLASFLTPADPRQIALALDRLLSYARAFNVACAEPADAARHYGELLRDLPADLVHLSVERVLRGWRWGNRLPTPGELRAAIEPELFERVSLHGRHRWALRLARERDELAARARQPLRKLEVTAPRPRRVPPARPPLDDVDRDANLARWAREGAA